MSRTTEIRIGGASGYWGESDMAVPQFLAEGGLDYIVFDYLAEITMSILARQRAKDSEKGFAADFVSAVLAPNLAQIAAQRVRVISNAGGVNPAACGRAVEALVARLGLDLKVAVITGDDLLERAGDLAALGPQDMFSGADFPDPERLASINAYLGAFPIAAALADGADIVITGRCVDSAVTLGACIHAFGWAPDQLDCLAGGSLAGHILECGPQATGGNFTDWHRVADTLDEVGYPIAEIRPDGSFTCTKPVGTGGEVSVGTVGEQMLYEIGDPAAYWLPDVCCDFTGVTLQATGPDRVEVRGARGRPAPETLKVCATWEDGWRAGAVSFFYGESAAAKARAFGESVLRRARARLRGLNAPDFTETLIELIGDESEYGAFAVAPDSRSVAVKIAARHDQARAAGLLLREMSGHGLAAPPGLSGFAGARAKPSPVLSLFSFLIPKQQVGVCVSMAGRDRQIPPGPRPPAAPAPPSISAGAAPVPVAAGDRDGTDRVTVPLIRLAWARSGDKGNKANIGILPRHKAYAPWIWAALSDDVIRARFAHFLQGDVARFYLPGTGAMNILLDQVLGGGGVASLRNDPQGKGYSQIVLQIPVSIPEHLLEAD